MLSSALSAVTEQIWGWGAAGCAFHSEPGCCEAVVLASLHCETLESLLWPKSEALQPAETCWTCGVQAAIGPGVCLGVCVGDLDVLLKQRESVNMGRSWL